MQSRRFTRLILTVRQSVPATNCGLHAVLDAEKDKELFLREASESAIAIDITPFCVRRVGASTWSIHSLGGNCPSHRSIQLPHVPDTIPLPGAQETCRLAAARRIAVLGRAHP